MEHDSIPGLEPEKLARLVGITLDKRQGEKRDAQAAISDLLETCLAETWPVADRKEKMWPKALGRLLGPRGADARRAVRDILLDPRSALGTVKDIRGYAKTRAARADDEEEHAVMTTIYFAAIANRLVFHGQRITTYSYESLCSSFARLQRKSWMPADLVGLFEKAQEACRNKIQDDRLPRQL